MTTKIEMLGKVFGRLTVLCEVEKQGRRLKYRCQCSCGNEVEVIGESLRSGSTKSCGCYALETRAAVNTRHGRYGTPLHDKWKHMKHRVLNPNSTSYPYYGGKGVKLQPEWNTFEGFLETMPEGYEEGMSLDRIDPAGDYTKENCRWIKLSDQSRNRSKRSDNKTGVTGVTYDEKTNKYTATWVEDGVHKAKSFSANKYGKEEAFLLAKEARQNALSTLIEEDIGYTNYHGK